MKEIYDRRAAPAAWPRPGGLAALDIDRSTGYKATPFCPKDVHYIESFIPGTEPTAFCPIHSPFGAVGNAGPMGGAPPDGAPQPTAPLPPGVGPPAPQGAAPAGPSPQPAPTGAGTGVMGGTGPTPSSPR
jgi:hypothetical protein